MNSESNLVQYILSAGDRDSADFDNLVRGRSGEIRERLAIGKDQRRVEHDVLQNVIFDARNRT